MAPVLSPEDPIRHHSAPAGTTLRRVPRICLRRLSSLSRHQGYSCRDHSRLLPSSWALCDEQPSAKAYTIAPCGDSLRCLEMNVCKCPFDLGGWFHPPSQLARDDIEGSRAASKSLPHPFFLKKQSQCTWLLPQRRAGDPGGHRLAR